jgi:predicted ArsR family transcriptional regulator
VEAEQDFPVHSPRVDRRFFASSRGQIVTLLRRTQSTVDDLAARLGLTDNAVRAHLDTLERDGLVEQRGLRRGEGKPSFLYELTPAAEQLFPKAYAEVLVALLDVLAAQLSPEALESIVRQAGARLAVAHRVSGASTGARAEVAVNMLNELGGLAELKVESDGFVIVGLRCPLAALLPRHPAACRLAETLLAETSGFEVTERCVREADHLECHFELRVAVRG